MQADEAASQSSGMLADAAGHVPTRSRWRPLLGVVIVGVVVYFSLMAANTFGIALDLIRADDTASSVWRAYSYRNTPDEPWRHGFGLTFAGWGGVVWAGALTLIVVLALGGVWIKQHIVRRTSLVLLIGAAALWAGNATCIATTADVEHFGPSAVLHLAGLIGAIVLLRSRWSLGAAAPTQR